MKLNDQEYKYLLLAENYEEIILLNLDTKEISYITKEHACNRAQEVADFFISETCTDRKLRDELYPEWTKFYPKSKN